MLSTECMNWCTQPTTRMLLLLVLLIIWGSCSGSVVFGLGVEALRAAFFGTEEGSGALEDEVRAKVLGADFVVCREGLRSAALKD